MSSTADLSEFDMVDDVSIHKPFRAGLPNLKNYFTDMWQRREFAVELSRATLRSQSAATFFGRVWLVLNPLFLAMVYYTLAYIVSSGRNKGPDYLCHLLAGIFVYHFFSQSMNGGAKSVVSVGKLVTSQSFPRLILPLSAVLVAFRRFLPSMLVYLIFHLVTHQPLSWRQLMAIPALIMIFFFALGVASLVAMLQVYFRDLRQFLPYLTRILLYITPVLYYADAVKGKLSVFLYLNPLFAMFGAWGDALVRGEIAPLNYWLIGASWTIATLLIGSLLFMSREREFAVRL
ncbi:MAG: ABC transporter permease [Actinobacteria bacterium]|nr:ABC transporter permease [Actinomycetota bacterium]NBY15569.1 ABC transporter permease [Actinomycetota bacterium]